VTPEQLSDVVRSALAAAVERGVLAVDVPAEVVIDRPKNPEHGDYATNVALRLAKAAGRPPREVAEVLATELRAVDGIAGVDVAGPGFLNITLAKDALGAIAVRAVTAGDRYGRGTALAGVRLDLEFVSANPTGPVHIGGSRWAAVGDAIGRLLEAEGADVTREYYINDAGAQIDRFARSLRATAAGEPVPEDGYGGTYIADIAAQVVAVEPDVTARDDAAQVQVFRDRGVEAHGPLRARPDDQLLHIQVGRVQQPAFAGGCEHRNGIRRPEGTEVGPFEGIHGNVDLGIREAPAVGFVGDPDLLADEEHRRFVALPFPDHDRAVDRHRVHAGAHRLDCDLVGFVAIPLAHRVSAGNRSLFDDRQEVE